MKKLDADGLSGRATLGGSQWFRSRLLLLPCVLLGLLSTSLQSRAGAPSDIDIFTGVPSTGDLPNVLFILDSSANWSTSIPGAANCYYNSNGVKTAVGPVDQGTKLGIEQCALYNLIDGLPVNTSAASNANALFNVGILLMNESPKSGGYPRKAFLPVTSNNKALLKTLIASFTKNGDKGSNADFGQVMYEAYLYYKAMAPLNGNLGSKYDSLAYSNGRYVSPSGNSCGRNYVIVIGNGSPQNSNPEKQVEALMNARIDTDLANLSAAERAALKAQIVNAALGNDAANWSDEMARFMRKVDVSGKDDQQGIVTHAVAVKKGPSDGNFPALMNSIANYGGGNYYEATSADVLLSSLIQIFNQIQAINSVFASASLPVSVNARGTYLNQVYMGMFRPDAAGKPRWRGNLKQYRFSLDATNSLSLVDATGAGAVSASTGFISPTAQSFWTTGSSYWTAESLGTPPSVSDAPDGDVVEKGAVGQRLRTVYATSQLGRPVYTCVSCASGTVLSTPSDNSTKFTDANSLVTQGMLGAASTAERTAIINWLRGENNAGDEIGPVTTPTTTVRPSVHGDVLHSRPAVVNYGGSTGVVVFYGANDGQLRAVNGNQTGSAGGDELWSFVPQEHYSKLKRLRDNSPVIDLSNTPPGLGATARDYAVDGPISIYQKSSGTAVDRVIIYVGMRRGGRSLYALDVTTPTAPKFLWKVSNASSGMSLLGQTWSEPRVGRVKGWSNPVLIFGGGYDAAAEDSGGNTTMGNVIYVLDAFDGTLLRAFSSLSNGSTAASLTRSIPADITLMDVDNDGKIDRAYAVDLGGQVYRIDFETPANTSPADWTLYKVADLSGGTSTGRKFFFPPDVVQTRNFTALLFGSGDREKPLLSATQDHFFQIFDRRTAKGAPTSATPFAFSTLAAAGSTVSLEGNGCYMPLAQGEKVVNAATSIAGSAYFGTNRPNSSPSGSVCSANLGITKSYAMPLFCVAASGSLITGGGLPPSPVAGIVTVTKSDGTAVQVPFIIGAPNAKGSAIEAQRLNPVITAPRKRRYWYTEE